MGAAPGGDPTKPTVTETEDLRDNTVAFILGPRVASAIDTKGQYKAPKPITDDGDNGAVVYNGHAVGQRSRMAPGLEAPNQFHQLASLEYCQAYFHNVLAGRVVPLGGDVPGYLAGLAAADRGSGPMGEVRVAKRLAQRDGLTAGEPGEPGIDGGANTLLNVADLGRQLGLSGSDASKVAQNYQGIFARDFGPFLKGKGGRTALLSATVGHAPQNANPEGISSKMRQPFSVSRNAGDELCFGVLEALMAKEGLLDWTPDGIVLSKGVNDPSDKLMDEYLDARDGQL